MIRLNLDVKDYSFDVSRNVRESFKKPILMKLDHKEYNFFTTYVIIDFSKLEMKYIQTYSDENLGKCKDVSLNIFSHSVTPIVSGKEFFDFLYNNDRTKNNCFKYFNVDEKELIVYFAQDLDIENKDVLGRTSQHGVNRGDKNNLIISFGRTDKPATETYMCSKDMKTAKKLFTLDGYHFPQHSVETFKDHLFTTEFEDVKFRTKYGEILNGEADIERLIKLRFDEHGGNSLPGVIYDKLFKLWREKNFNIDEFERCPGEIIVFNLKDLNEPYKVFETGFAPSHIQFDEENDILYVSSHNFMKIFEDLILLAPAEIHKYKLVDGELVYLDYFTEPTFWRCPDHVFFRHNGHPYIAAMGFPNRLFFIDAETMKLHYYYDIKGDIISEQKDLRVFLNNLMKNSKEVFLSSIPSLDGNYISFWDQENMYILDFDKRKIIESVGFKMESTFRQNTTHSVYM